MPFAIELYFDTKFTNYIKNIRTKLAIEGVNIDDVSDPHLSLAICDDIDRQKIKLQLQKVASQTNSWQIRFTNFGIFSSPKTVIFLSPKVDEKLLGFQHSFHNILKPHCHNIWVNYKPAIWVPHVTLGYKLNEAMLKKAMEVICNIAMPLTAKVLQIGILEFEPNQDLVRYSFRSR